MGQITTEDKEKLEDRPLIAEKNKFTAENYNEIKAAINDNHERILAQEQGNTTPTRFYTPILAAQQNITSISASEARYIDYGESVSVWVQVTFNPTSAAFTIFDLSLPVDSNLEASGDLIGTGTTTVGSLDAAFVFGDVANNRAEIRWNASSSTPGTMYLHFNYKKMPIV